MKIVLVDGNNLMFRSYFATAYTGNLMKNSKGLVTNALYGFVNMINKIIETEKPEYMAVAFDIGPSFRHREYKEYKAGRNKTPEELKIQLPIAREMLKHMGIKVLTKEDYEADDIIGTLSHMADLDPAWDATLVTSDHDYLQLITDVVEVKLLKTKGFIRYNPINFKEDYGIDPIRVTDLKGLMGDSSDNIPGVPGVGEKTALKLLSEYETIENLYDHIDEIKGKLQEKLIDAKDSAIFSKRLATIVRDVPLDITFEDLKYEGPESSLNDFFQELEFYSLIKNDNQKSESISFKELSAIKDIKLGDIAYYIECDNENYHIANIIGMGLYDGENAFYVPAGKVRDVYNYIKDSNIATFDLKKNVCLLKDFSKPYFDLNIAAYLLNKTLKDDIAVLMNNEGDLIPIYQKLTKDQSNIEEIIVKKAMYIYHKKDEYLKMLKEEEMLDLFNEIEIPLVKVLAKMENTGIKCDANILNEMKDKISVQIEELSQEIYDMCGVEFNIASPLQLGNVLFETLGLPGGKKNAKGYKTGAEILEKMIGMHPVIEHILKYRNITKIYSTYLEGLNKYILSDGCIHTIYKQTLTRTGRLSSVDPNLQNIPARDELGRLVRKAFLPVNDLFLSADYSQIELRILAHISNSTELINAFVNDEDIHTRVASDIFSKPFDEVSKNERRIAKSVIFGIVYGISGFGLGENIGISSKEAKEFIKKYYELYPGVKNYMDNIVSSAYETTSVRTLFNRKRVIDELTNSNFMIKKSGERIALNTPIQGSSADIIKKAMVEIDDELEKQNLKSKMILQIHDELVFDIVEEEKETITKLVKDIMENTVKLSVPLKVSSDYGKDLYETK